MTVMFKPTYTHLNAEQLNISEVIIEDVYMYKDGRLDESRAGISRLTYIVGLMAGMMTKEQQKALVETLGGFAVVEE